MLAARAKACLRRQRLSSSPMASAYSTYHGAANGSEFTVTALGRWSVLTKQLPGAMFWVPGRTRPGRSFIKKKKHERLRSVD